MAEETNVQDVVGLIDGEGNVSSSDTIKLLRALRGCKIRRSDIVAKLGKKVLESRAVAGNEIWTVYEQVLMASLDVGDLTFAKQCLAKLVKQFPDSARVKRASGMVMEFSGKYEEALAIYDEVLESSPTNVVVLKRKACVSKAQGDLLSTVNALNSLLQINAGDISSWIEMGEIYVSLCDCEAAAFCFEEIILLQPNCAQYHSRLAEIYYTNGQFDSLLKARSHYSMALNLQTVGSGNTRALYGLILTCRKLKPMIEDEKEKEYAVTCELLAWATERLQEVSSCMNSSCKHLGILGE